MRPTSPLRLRRVSRVVFGVLCAWVGALALLGWAAVPASAHNGLLGTNPSDGATLDRTPTSVVLTFDQPALALGSAVVVTGPTGPLPGGPLRLVDNTVSQDIEPGAPAGEYTVTWRVTSVDGHPISGEFSFNSAAASDAEKTLPSAAAEPVDPVAEDGPDGNAVPLWLIAVAVAAVLTVVLSVAKGHRGVASRSERPG
ncbi:MAG TPA: copper resistance CopC family protein [Propionibacteriaceae bacterium]|nr:copper resistance CopC family protein [Propionibacteriaceae bacterium]